MRHRATVHHIAVLTFFLTISYSLVLPYDLTQQQNLASFGSRVIAQYSLASLAMLLAWWSAPSNPSYRNYSWLIIVAVTARLILLYVDPYTSNDVLRYLFDGRVALEGLDPYRVPHNAAELIALREQWMPPAEHAKYPTLYPPLALALFSLAASSGQEHALWVWNIMTTVASLMVVFVGYLVLQHANKLRHFPLLALSPLLVLEAGEGMHIDIFAALMVLIAIRYWQLNRTIALGVAIGIGAMLKILPVLLLLPMFVLQKTWPLRFTLVFSTLSCLLAGYGGALALGLRPVGSLGIFFEKWRSGSPLFHWLEPYLNDQLMLTLIFSLTFIGFVCIGAVLWRNASMVLGKEVAQSRGVLAMQAMFIIPLLLSPVIFPWYLLPLIVLMALRPSAFVISWTISLPLIYEVLDQFVCCKIWITASWPIHVIGISLLLALAIDCGLVSRTLAVIAKPAKRLTEFTTL